MKRICAAAAVVALSAGLAFAQSGGGSSSGGSASGSAGSSGTGAGSGAGTGGTTAGGNQSGAGSSATPGTATNGPNNAGGPVPGLSTPAPSDSTTVGRAPGVNPGNPQDARRRGNPSDRSLPGASNPQDMKAFENSEGVPQIMAPERR